MKISNKLYNNGCNTLMPDAVFNVTSNLYHMLKLRFSRTILRYVRHNMAYELSVCMCLSSVTLLRLTQKVKIFVNILQHPIA